MKNLIKLLDLWLLQAIKSIKKGETIDVFLGQISHIGLRLTVCQPFLTVIKATDLCQMMATISTQKTTHTNLTDNFAFLNQTGM